MGEVYILGVPEKAEQSSFRTLLYIQIVIPFTLLDRVRMPNLVENFYALSFWGFLINYFVMELVGDRGLPISDQSIFFLRFCSSQ